MSENQKQNLNGAVLVVLSTILGVTVAFLGWTAKSVIAMSSEMAALKQQVSITVNDVQSLKDRGSPILQAVMVRLDGIQAGQTRIEKSLEDHMKEQKIKP